MLILDVELEERVFRRFETGLLQAQVEETFTHTIVVEI